MSFKEKIAAQRAALAARNAAFAKTYKFKVGKTHLYILPGLKNPDDVSREFGVHYIKDLVTGQMITSVGDAGICYGKDDPVRQAIQQLIEKANAVGDDDTAKKVKDWLAKPRYIVNAVVLKGSVDAENVGKVVQVDFSTNGWDGICSVFEQIMEEVDGFDIKNGAVITVERKGTTVTDTEYSYMPSLKQPATPPKQELLDKAMDLDTFVDGKFGDSVRDALAKLSNFLGRDVSGSAIGAAIASNAALAGPKTAPVDDDLISSLGSDTTGAVDADFDDLLGGDSIPETGGAKPAETKATESAGSLEDIMADLDNL